MNGVIKFLRMLTAWYSGTIKRTEIWFQLQMGKLLYIIQLVPLALFTLTDTLRKSDLLMTLARKVTARDPEVYLWRFELMSEISVSPTFVSTKNSTSGHYIC